MANYILAHDLGTTGNKATLYDAEGKLKGSVFHGYTTEYAFPNWAEQNPEDWWNAVVVSTQRLLQETKVPSSDIACITFSGQMMAAVPVNRNGLALRHAIIWADQRSTAQTMWLRERVSFEDLYAITGHRLSESYSLLKILWLRDNQPEIYKSTHKFLHAKDYIVARLTGTFATDRSDASGMDLYDLENDTWSDIILEAAGIERSKLPDVYASTDVVGTVLSDVAGEIGIAAGTPVVIGGGDGVCASAGAGVVREGAAYNYIGSSSWIAIATSKPIFDPLYRTFTYCHLVPGMYMPTGTTQSAGASYQWTRETICQAEVYKANHLNLKAYELMDIEAQASSVGANGLIFLPYLMGERTPYWNPEAKGAFIGLTIRHTRADMVRAVLEGVAMNLSSILKAFIDQNTNIKTIRLIGGGAKSPLWNQIMADVYGVPVYRMTILEEATSMGAALAGGVGVGLYDDFALADVMNPVARIIEPDLKAHQRYQELADIFFDSYGVLESINGRLHDYASLA